MDKCSKCQGLMVSDVLLCEVSYWMSGLRCVNCGKWTDLKEEVGHANQTKDRRVVDELELYKIRSRGRGVVRVLQMKDN